MVRKFRDAVMKDAQIRLRMEGNALGMVRKLEGAAMMDAQTMSNKEVYA